MRETWKYKYYKAKNYKKSRRYFHIFIFTTNTKVFILNRLVIQLGLKLLVLPNLPDSLHKILINDILPLSPSNRNLSKLSNK